MEKYELKPNFDSRNSFYKKAYVIEEENTIKLKSYQTIVAEIKNNKPLVYGTYSPTTLRHIKEFLKQHMFKAETSSQILKDYSPSEEEEKESQKAEEEKFKGLFDSLKMVCALGDVMTDKQEEQNDFKKRMLNAGLGDKGLSFPSDWETLTEEEKSLRLNGALEQI